MPKLDKLLLKNQQYDAQYRNGLANHMSMSLIALSKLQVSDHTLEKFFVKNSKKLESLPKPTGCQISDATLEEYLGKHAYYADFVVFFRHKLAEFGREQMLKKYLVILSSGIAAGAFHGLLRLAYGLFMQEQDSEMSNEEIIRGLAYWADAYLSLEDSDSSQEKPVRLSSIMDEFDYTLLQEVRQKIIEEGHHLHLIYHQILFASEQSPFKLYVKKINFSNQNLADIANFSVRLYFETHDFTALHAVTATHAFRALLPFIEDKDRAINSFWRGIFASYLTIGAPKITLTNSLESHLADHSQWNKIIEAARFSSDEHVVKFVYTCMEEFKYYHNPLYIRSAAIKAGLCQLVIYDCAIPKKFFWQKEIVHSEIETRSSPTLEIKM